MKADAVIADGVADAAISRPLLRSEIEELLCRIAAGEKQLQGRLRGNAVTARCRDLHKPQGVGGGRQCLNREVAIEALSPTGGSRSKLSKTGLDAVSTHQGACMTLS